jgi:hypothetical protein
MKTVSWIGILILVLGIASLLIPLPRVHDHGIKVGNESVDIITRHDEKAPPVVTALLIAAGGALLILGLVKTR